MNSGLFYSVLHWSFIFGLSSLCYFSVYAAGVPDPLQVSNGNITPSSINAPNNINNEPASTAATTPQKTPEELKKEELEKQEKLKERKKYDDAFDRIRDFESYDPENNKWSKVEKFENVKILDKQDDTREQTYLYNQFWAYDPKKKKWEKVDINSYGYPRKGKDWAKLFGNFFRGFSLDFYGGIGQSKLEGNVRGQKKIVRIEDTYYIYLDDTTNQIYTINWFDTKMGIRKVVNWQQYETSYIVTQKAPKDFHVKLSTLNIPLHLQFYYTFFYRLRLGLFTGFYINKLKGSSSNGFASSPLSKEAGFNAKAAKIKIKTKQFYQVAIGPMLGFNLLTRQNHAIFADFIMARHTHHQVEKFQNIHVARWLGQFSLGYIYYWGSLFKISMKGFVEKRFPDAIANLKSRKNLTKLNIKDISYGVMLGMGISLATRQKMPKPKNTKTTKGKKKKAGVIAQKSRANK